MLRKTIIILLMTLQVFGQKEKEVLKKKLDEYLISVAASTRVAVSFNSLHNSKVQYHRNASQLIPAASLIKLPIIIELYAQADEDKLSLNDEYTFEEADIANEDGSLHKNSVGSKFKLKELARLMMVASDNSATNILINKVSREAVNARMKKLGFQQIYLNRKMMDTAAVSLGIQNFVSAREYNLLLNKLYEYDILDKKATNSIINLMKDCNDKTTFPALLPSHVVVAHKTGSLNIVRSDGGIFFCAKPFLLTVLVEGFASEKEAENIIANVAKICYETTNIQLP